MSWLKIEDGFPTHLKAARAGLEAVGFWVAGLCFCARTRSDGRINKADLDFVWPYPVAKGLLPVVNEGKIAALAARLVDAGLWEDCGDHYMVHDYLVYQESKTEIDQKRAAAAERQRAARERLSRLRQSSHADRHTVTDAKLRQSSHADRHTPCRGTAPTPTSARRTRATRSAVTDAKLRQSSHADRHTVTDAKPRGDNQLTIGREGSHADRNAVTTREVTRARTHDLSGRVGSGRDGSGEDPGSPISGGGGSGEGPINGYDPSAIDNVRKVYNEEVRAAGGKAPLGGLNVAPKFEALIAALLHTYGLETTLQGLRGFAERVKEDLALGRFDWGNALAPDQVFKDKHVINGLKGGPEEKPKHQMARDGKSGACACLIGQDHAENPLWTEHEVRDWKRAQNRKEPS